MCMHAIVPISDICRSLLIVSIVVPFLVNQNLCYRILTIKLVNQRRNYNGDYRYNVYKIVAFEILYVVVYHSISTSTSAGVP